jgi:hypothetical protein
MRCPNCNHVVGRESDVDRAVAFITAADRPVRHGDVQAALGWTNSRASVTIHRARHRGLIERAADGTGYTRPTTPASAGTR